MDGLKWAIFELLAKNHITIYGMMMRMSLEMVILGYLALETLAFDINFSSDVLDPLRAIKGPRTTFQGDSRLFLHSQWPR